VITEGNGGINTVGAGTPPPSGVVASVPLAFGVDSIDVVGNRLYAATTLPNDLRVLDVSNPLAPTVLGSVPLASNSAQDLVVQGNVAFLAEAAGLQVYDVSNPAAPAFLDGDTTNTGLLSLAVGPNVVYAGVGSKLAVYDVSTPSNTTFLTSLNVGGTALGLGFDGGAVVLAQSFSGIATFNATTPTAPTAAGTLALSQALGVALMPPRAFVTQFSGTGIDDRLAVVDYSVLNAPATPAHVSLPGSVHRVTLAGPHAYVSAFSSGVNVVDVSVPTAPVHVGSIPVPARVADLDVDGGFIYLAGSFTSGEILVLRAVQVVVP
jgi:hypothetical protein